MNHRICSPRTTLTAAALVMATCAPLTFALAKSDGQQSKAKIVRAAAPSRAIDHVIVIDLENENYNATFGANSPAV